MPMSAEQKAAQSERMKAQHAAGKMGRKNGHNQVLDAGQEPPTFVDPKGWSVVVSVDWEKLPMLEAQNAYVALKKQFERAGFIMNQRSMPERGSYICFICKQKHLGDPRGKDYSYTDPKTGLMQVVEICGERCWIGYQELRIKERKDREHIPRQ
jgi:hypothetical protein